MVPEKFVSELVVNVLPDQTVTVPAFVNAPAVVKFSPDRLNPPVEELSANFAKALVLLA